MSQDGSPPLCRSRSAASFRTQPASPPLAETPRYILVLLSSSNTSRLEINPSLLRCPLNRGNFNSPDMLRNAFARVPIEFFGAQLVERLGSNVDALPIPLRRAT